ncbi:helix-turn-helix domain-containing protein [endosymbiont of Riftia pachyptila]|uniref:Transcriptional activator protein fnrA n=1 Tax=endosymbiont of Riftia pachyptila (vent Ph05) TaxID=1048808 RepID=G2D958_9GAMM|nr:helix-turn-helix domain-containing protein [endosymbiont of Riftia pachyptila]EGV52925.1 transcriptional activator protein fnrA [endosymbiont of Riftia pachyptila (vent Ph05)]
MNSQTKQPTLFCEMSQCWGGDAAVECSSCGLDPLCALVDYGTNDSAAVDEILLANRAVAKGETLFRVGMPFFSIFSVKSGAFKTLLPSSHSADQIIGFHLPGELMGVEGIAQARYPFTVRALEVSHICELRLDRLNALLDDKERVQQAIISMLSGEVAFQYSLTAELIRQSAEGRVAAFLLNLSRRLVGRGFSGSEFNLPMSRVDIGNFLGLAPETITRFLKSLERKGLIEIRRKSLKILDEGGVAALAEAGE